jgi:hypothetical protein
MSEDPFPVLSHAQAKDPATAGFLVLAIGAPEGITSRVTGH